MLCSACSGLGAEECPKHGKDFIQYKCRFCCGFGTFFCWGTTHFCRDCHTKQENHEYLSNKDPSELPQCPGPDKCPLKIRHPPNGQEFSLGCGLCVGAADKY
jgi:E3 ubiquitin-protein ligase MYCBP2